MTRRCISNDKFLMIGNYCKNEPVTGTINFEIFSENIFLLVEKLC